MLSAAELERAFGRVARTHVFKLDFAVGAVGALAEGVGEKIAGLTRGVLAKVVDAFIFLADDGMAESLVNEGFATLARMGCVGARAEKR